MANKKITDLVEITSAADVDVLAIVDVSADTTNKIKVDNLPVSAPVQTALDAKQATLVSGTNIKTINSTSLLGSGDISVASAWGSISGTLSNQTDLQTALDAKLAKAVGSTYTVNALLAVTQAEYDALTPSSTTLYFIV